MRNGKRERLLKERLKNPQLTFVQTICGHVTGGDTKGVPFPPDVERSLLELLHNKAVWPCFRGTHLNYGSRGMPTLEDYHERLGVGGTGGSGGTGAAAPAPAPAVGGSSALT